MKAADPTAGASNYCDMAENPAAGWGGTPCVEVDLLEANRHAMQAAIHTKLGGAYGSGECDRNGCFSRVGGPEAPRELRSAYGQGSGYTIDTSRPFDVDARADAKGAISVQLSQGASRVTSFDMAMAGNPQGTGVPHSALQPLREAQGRLALVVSLWTADVRTKQCPSPQCLPRAHVPYPCSTVSHTLAPRSAFAAMRKHLTSSHSSTAATQTRCRVHAHAHVPVSPCARACACSAWWLCLSLAAELARWQRLPLLPARARVICAVEAAYFRGGTPFASAIASTTHATIRPAVSTSLAAAASCAAATNTSRAAHPSHAGATVTTHPSPWCARLQQPLRA